MKKKITFGIFTVAIITICCSAFIKPEVQSPCDSPLVGDHSGAPGETNCTYCHAGTANTGPGTLEFHVGNDLTYVPGQTYNCTVKMTQGSLTKFGFVDLALKNSNNTTIGTFNLIDPNSTRKYTLGSRNYISHTPCGADVDTLGQKYWTYSWTAPSTNVGTITLYISGLAANHDEATTGDYTYTTFIVLNPSATAVQELAATISNLNIYPNPASEFLNLSYENISDEQTEIILADVVGKKISTLYSGKDAKGEVKKSFDIKNISKGIYWIRVSQGEKSTTKKFAVI